MSELVLFVTVVSFIILAYIVCRFLFPEKKKRSAYKGYIITPGGPRKFTWRKNIDAPASLLEDFVDEKGFVWGFIGQEGKEEIYLVLPCNVGLSVSLTVASNAQGLPAMTPPGSALVPILKDDKWVNPDGSPWVYEDRVVTTLDVDGVVKKRASEDSDLS